VEDADHGGILARHDTGDAAGETAVATGRADLDEDLIALHGAVQFIGRNKNVFVDLAFEGFGLLGSVGADEAVAVAVEIEFAGGEVFAGLIPLAGRLARACALICRFVGSADGPDFAVELGQCSAGGEAGELLEQETAFAAAAEAELGDELLVAGAVAGGALNAAQQVLIGALVRGGMAFGCGPSSIVVLPGRKTYR
jgi:hypothetical protein